MALNIKPLSDRVIIEPAAAETQTASGIIIPDTAKEKPKRNCCSCWKRQKRRTVNGESWRCCTLW